MSEKTLEQKKPYKLRGLCAEDIFPMLAIIKKIGLNELKECFNKETLEAVVGTFVNGKKGKTDNGAMAAVGMSLLPSVLEVADILVGNLSKCENEFYKFLENISDLSVDEIKKLNMADFFEMIVDVIKKEEFKDFFKVVSKLFK